MKFETLTHEDVRGNKLNYLKLTNGNKNMLINIGEKTKENVDALLTADQPELPLQEQNTHVLPSNKPKPSPKKGKK